MKKLAVARRYAKALIFIGKDDGLAESYKKELQDFTSLVGNNNALAQAIMNPLYAKEDRRKVLVAIIKKAGLSQIMSAFVVLLFDKGRIQFLDDINRAYSKLFDELKNIARASVFAATELSAEALAKIQTGLGKMTGKEVIIDFSREPGLIGGIITKIGDLVLDGSVRTQLRNLRESIKRGESV